MKTFIHFTFSFFILALISCDKEKTYKDYNEYFGDKDIVDISVKNDNLWLLSRQIDRAAMEREPWKSSLSYKYQMTQIHDNGFEYTENVPFMKLTADKKGENLFGSTYGAIYEIENLEKHNVLLQEKSVSIQYFYPFNHDSIWLFTNKGLALYSNDSMVPLKVINLDIDTLESIGLGIDSKGELWVPFYEGKILKYSSPGDTVFDLINNGLIDNESRLTTMLIDKNDNVFIAGYKNSQQFLLRYDGSNWNYFDLPDFQSGFISLLKDLNGVIWVCQLEQGVDNDLIRLYYLRNGTWKQIQDINSETMVTCVEVYKNKLYVGTYNGLYTEDFNY